MYSFVYVLMRLTSLALKQHFFRILSMQTRLVSLISTLKKRILCWPPYMHSVYTFRDKMQYKAIAFCSFRLNFLRVHCFKLELFCKQHGCRGIESKICAIFSIVNQWDPSMVVKWS